MFCLMSNIVRNNCHTYFYKPSPPPPPLLVDIYIYKECGGVGLCLISGVRLLFGPGRFSAFKDVISSSASCRAEKTINLNGVKCVWREWGNWVFCSLSSEISPRRDCLVYDWDGNGGWGGVGWCISRILFCGIVCGWWWWFADNLWLWICCVEDGRC